MMASPGGLQQRSVKFRVGLATQPLGRDQGQCLSNTIRDDPIRWDDNRHLTIIVPHQGKIAPLVRHTQPAQPHASKWVSETCQWLT
jgi:hypothetical protein